jgi:hypothetical protein
MKSTHKFKIFVLLGILLFVTQFINLVKYDLNLEGVLYFIGASIFSFLYFCTIKGSIKDNFAVLFLIFYIWISIMVAATFQFWGDKYTGTEYQALASFGGKLYFIFFIAAWLCSLFKTNHIFYRNLQLAGQRPFSTSFVVLFFVSIFLISIFCRITGIGKMGMEPTILPFHLNGIIQAIKKIIPYFFLLILVKNIRNRKQLYQIFLLIIFWGLLESFITFSKSGLINAFLPIIMYYLLSVQKLDKSVIKVFAFILILFAFLYPIIASMRTTSNINHVNAVKMAMGTKQEEKEEKQDGRISAIYSRTFSAGHHYIKDMPFVQSDNFFDFSRTVAILIMGGSAQYQTFVVDKYPLFAIHSSGTTGLTDAFLLGGYGFCYITLVFLVLVAYFIDSNRIKKNICLRVVLLIIFTEIVRTRTYSYFIDGVATFTLATNFFILFFILKTYKSATIKSLNKL